VSAPRACHSCGHDSAFVRRVRCGRCGDQVHPTCRDITGTCYQCRYRQAHANGIVGDMLPPGQAGEEPFKGNQPTTVAEGQPLPKLATYQNPFGASANALRIATAALYAGWHVEGWESGSDRVMLRKKGRGYLRLTFTCTGRLIRADTQRLYLTPNTNRVLEYLEAPK